ncbi:hypothetical protein [Amycolatopsis sp. NBC_01480]|uniref:hypothetical protein n=1 Tax=Amycolatopsis sp. NBC_01480 TaxID=2903562 RepID=UPI002E2CE223|nr:hypothetical protein [Amycolatopsis sp. NBC_01480]
MLKTADQALDPSEPPPVRRPGEIDGLPEKPDDWSAQQLRQVEDELWVYGFKVLKDAIRTDHRVVASSNVPISMTEEQRRILQRRLRSATP